MTDQTGPQDDESRTDGTPGTSPDARRGEEPESVLTGFSWDDPSGSTRPDPAAASSSTPQGDEPGHGSSAYVKQAPQAPDAQPPAASYPSAPGASPEPYVQAPGQPYGQAPSQPYGQGEPYGQQYGQQANQQADPYAAPSTGYGQSAEYTSTPQPYAYGPPPLSAEAEKARSNAVLWTVLNVVAVFFCVNLLSIVGAILAAVAIGRARDDVQSARNLTKWSWILFAIGFAVAALLVIGFVVLALAGALGTAGLNGEFSSL